MQEHVELEVSLEIIMAQIADAKLTPILRHNESYDALIKKVKEIENSKYKDDIYIYIRGNKENNFNPILIFPSKEYDNAIKAIESARIMDDEQTKKEFEDRYNYVIEQMSKRQTPKEQLEQFEMLKQIKEEGK